MSRVQKGVRRSWCLWLWLGVIWSGCYRPALPTPPYRRILSTYGHEVGYKMRIGRSQLSQHQARQRVEVWCAGHKSYVSFEAQKPIRNKSDLVYIGYLPSFPAPDTTIGRPFPPLRYWMTVANQPDSSFVWLSNVEVFTSRHWEPLVDQRFGDNEPTSVRLWLEVIDGLFLSLLEELKYVLQSNGLSTPEVR